jgi:threonine/homoserine/homoserine lactone efflux protein
MRSLPAFLAVALAVTLTPGPALALLLQVSAVHGRRAALANIAGNSVGVLAWGVLAAVGVSALVAANQLAYDVLRISGAAFLLWLGVRALLAARAPKDRGEATDRARAAGATNAAAFDGGRAAPGTVAPDGGRARSRHPTVRGPDAWRAGRRGLVNSLANPKLAVFFVALFPQFLSPGAAVLPAALAMAAVIVAFDIVWYGSIALLVDRFREVLRPRVMRRLERLSGAVLVAFGVRLATESR